MRTGSRIFERFRLLLLTGLLSAHSVYGQQEYPRLMPNQPIPDAELEAYVDAFVTARATGNRLVGVTLSIVQNGEVQLAKGYGFADLESGRRVDPDTTLFRIGSITKTFTYIAAMQLVEAGEISVDDPVNDHLPSDLQIPDDGYSEPIRIRHLLTHQPGFEDRALGILFAADPDAIRPLSRFLRETRPMRVRPPGEVSSYSNYGIALLGAIIEQKTGRQWQDVIEDDILTPLGMTRTSGREPYPARDDLPRPMSDELAQSAATGYRPAGAGHAVQSYEYITQVAPAGSMSSTAADMARYMLMLLNDGQLDGARIFGPGTARAFRTPMTTLPPEIGSWDAGFAEFPLPGGFRSYGHDGATLVFFSSMIVVPALDLGIFVSTNTAGGALLTSALAPFLVNHFYGPEIPAPIKGDAERRDELAEYAGEYSLTRREYDGLAGFLMGAQTARVSVSPEGYLILTAGPRPQRFVPTDEPDVFRSADGLGILKFERRDGQLILPTVAVAFEKIGALERPAFLIGLAALAVFASVATLIGVRIRAGRGLAATTGQAWASRFQSGAAVLWLMSLACVGIFAAGVAPNPNALVFTWPTTSILVFSTMALLASVVSWSAIGFLPAVWRGRDGWSRGRKIRYSAAVIVFGALGLLLLSQGALQPWNP